MTIKITEADRAANVEQRAIEQIYSEIPETTSPVIKKFFEVISYKFGQEQRDELQKILPMLANTRSPDHEAERRNALALAAVQKIAPFYLRKAGMVEWADRLAAFSGTLKESHQICLDARNDAVSEYVYEVLDDAAYAALAALEASTAHDDAEDAAEFARSSDYDDGAAKAAAKARESAFDANITAADAVADAAVVSGARRLRPYRVDSDVFPVVMTALRDAIAVNS